MKIATHTLAVLSRCNVVGQNLYLPPGQLDRKDYEAVNKVIEAMGGKWNRSARAHVFAGVAADGPLEDVLLTGEITTHRDLGFFATRGQALDMLMDRADVRMGDYCLEPSAGEGDIAERLVLITDRVACVEIDKTRHRGLLAAGFDAQRADFTQVPPSPIFDRVVMNPPFSVPGDRRADLNHVLHAIGFLKPGGRLAAVIGSGVAFREDNRTVKFHERICHLSPEWTPLPAGSFSASGTDVNTVILTLDAQRA